MKTLTGAKVFSVDDIKDYKNDIDVLIICGGSATDLPVQTPEYCKDFNVVDSFLEAGYGIMDHHAGTFRAEMGVIIRAEEHVKHDVTAGDRPEEAAHQAKKRPERVIGSMYLPSL